MSLLGVRTRFIDRTDVNGLIRAHQQAERRFLFGAGVRVQRGIRKRLLRRRGASRPGQSPHAHAQSNNGLRFVRFTVNPHIVAIGSVKFAVTRSTLTKPLPATMEFGGRVRPSRRASNRRGRRFRQIQRRPYAAPGLRETQPQLNDLYRDVFSYKGL